jgi:L-glyceraldehyde 3-phosphate reductase
MPWKQAADGRILLLAEDAEIKGSRAPGESGRPLNALAQIRGQTLAQMALVWILRRPQITSVLIGASSTAQVDDAVGAMKNPAFSGDELHAIEEILAGNQ